MRRKSVSGAPSEGLPRAGSSATYSSSMKSEPANKGSGTFAGNLDSGSMRALLEDSEGVLHTVVAIAPLPVGAWVAGGPVLENPLIFALVLAMLIFCHYAKNMRRVGWMVPFPDTIVQLLHVGLVALLLAFYSVTRDVTVSSIALIVVLLLRLGDFVELRSSRQVLLVAISIVARMTLLPILGAYSQFPAVVFQAAILGLIPGGILAAAFIATHADILEQGGWVRSFTHTNKKGEVSERPGGVTRAYVLMLLLGPTLPVAVLPFTPMPAPFILSALPLGRAPVLCQQFASKTVPDSITARQTTKLAAWATVLVLLLGMAATYRLI